MNLPIKIVCDDGSEFSSLDEYIESINDPEIRQAVLGDIGGAIVDNDEYVGVIVIDPPG